MVPMILQAGILEVHQDVSDRVHEGQRDLRSVNELPLDESRQAVHPVEIDVPQRVEVHGSAHLLHGAADGVEGVTLDPGPAVRLLAGLAHLLEVCEVAHLLQHDPVIRGGQLLLVAVALNGGK